MELHKLCCFLTQGRELPYFWSSTMEVQSFISLKLQTAFPTVWLSFFNKATFTPHFVQSTFYSQYIKFTENSFLYHFLTWIKAIFYASYHLYRLFRWSTPQISALGRVTIAPIFRRAVKVGQKLIMTYQVRHRNMRMRQQELRSCASSHVSWLTGKLYCPQIR